MEASALRRRFYVDPEVQFPLILCLILVVTAEGLFVGWGFSRAVAAAKDWGNPRQVADFFLTLAFTIVPVVVLNFALGTWLSHKIAGPLAQIRRLMGEITRGNLEGEAHLRRGDFLLSHAQEFNRMLQTLRRLIYRDHRFAVETDELLVQCEKRIAGLPPEARDELRRLIADARSRLSIINAHFVKGRQEAS